MRPLFTLAAVALLAGCASKGDVMERQTSPAQNYRLQGQDKPVQISGRMERKFDGIGWTDNYQRVITVYFDGEPAIEGVIPKDYTGELSGAWNGQPVSTSCSSRRVSATWQEVSCMVFVGSERTVTLRF